MKRILKASSAPQPLSGYIETYPLGDSRHTWKAFCDELGNPSPKKVVQRQLRDDQRGLCAYCEIDLIEVPAEEIETARNQGIEPPKADFTVEHLHPKSDPMPVQNHWQLRWDNLVACCAGGAEKLLPVAHQNRIAIAKNDHSCNQRRGNNSTQILNPLSDIPPFPSLLKYTHSNGKLEVDNVACVKSQIYATLVSDTLRTLNLNCARLNTARQVAIESLKKRFQEILEASLPAGKLSAQTIDAANVEIIEHTGRSLAKEVFTSEGSWPPFFTAIRSYLGQVAEEQLQAINYNG